MLCKIEHCKNEAKVLDMCKKHYHKHWYEQNKTTVLQTKKRYYKQNRDRIIKYALAYNRTEKGKEIKRKYCNRSRKLPKNRVIRNTYKRLRKILKSHKSDKTMNLVGCTPNFLREYLQSKFQFGMTWDNYGSWHIDHIRPCCSFDLTDPIQQQKCFHYTNLQPLWAKDNIIKGSKY